MKRVFFYSLLLLAGMGTAQTLDLEGIHAGLLFVTMSCLSYIMIEVGLDFALDKSRLRAYGIDFGIASMAAGLPWAFCAAYLAIILGTPWKEAWLVGLFAAPTSAGVLFTLMSAVGLGATWMYQKARTLAIFDDLATVLFLIPLQILFVGLKPELFGSLTIMVVLYAVVYRWLHQLPCPRQKPWLLVYGMLITAGCWVLREVAHIHLESLMPAFALGCLIRRPEHHEEADDPHSYFDQGVKALFMFLVGASLPQVSFAGARPGTVLWQVLILTLLANLGKCAVLLGYRNETSFRERLALSVALFPRGEVGAGVLLIASGYGLAGLSETLAGLCLALNLLLTGVFIWTVMRLLGFKQEPR